MSISNIMNYVELQKTDIADVVSKVLSKKYTNTSLIQESRDNIVVLLSNTNSSVVCRVSLNKNVHDVGEESSYIKHLAANGVPVATILALTKINGYPLIIFDYVDSLKDDYWLLSIGQRRSLSQKAGALLYRIHDIGQSYASDNPYSVQRTVDAEIVALIGNKHQVNQAYSDAKELLDDAKKMHDKAKSQTRGIGTIIHNDYRPQNILVDIAGRLVAIDFDWSCKTNVPLKDVGHACLEWSFKDGADNPDLPIISSFIRGYQSEGSYKYSPEDVFFWMCYSAVSDASSYIVSCLPSQTNNQIKPLSSYMYNKYKYLITHKEDIIKALKA